MQDVGLGLHFHNPALERVRRHTEHVFGTFQVLGGLGLLLGSAGLAIVVLRNMLRRHAELGLLTAIGFHRAELIRMTWIEHGTLLAAGLAIGVIAAIIAVLPAIVTTPGRTLPMFQLPLHFHRCDCERPLLDVAQHPGCAAWQPPAFSTND